MLTYPYVEDYLELLAGYDPSAANAFLFADSKYKFSLARYDVQIVESMAVGSLFNSTALTDKQGALAVQLVLKYRRQFAKYDIDVTPVENPQFRMPLRKIDRTKSIWFEDSKVKIKFPYDQNLINEMREFKAESQGTAAWDSDAKTWAFGLTEYNVNWLVSWAQLNSFTIDPEITRIFDSIIAVENTPYRIELVGGEDGLSIINAADSLIEYVNQQLGGFSWDNLIRLVDNAGVLGYTVDATLLEYCSAKYGTALEYIGTRRKVHLSPASDLSYWDWLLDYAELTNRYPICIYDSAIVDFDLSRFGEQDVVHFDHNGKTKTSDYDPYNVKVVYARKIPTHWDFPVPLLITTRELLHSGKKLDWLNRAEKIVYWTNTLINETM